jgi:hypothetical protein
MAHFEIARQVCTGTPGTPDAPGDWVLCFQYGTYHYDPDQDTSMASERGYRFIWRRPNGQLQGARGQARLTPESITQLMGRAAEGGWYPSPPVIAR